MEDSRTRLLRNWFWFPAQFGTVSTGRSGLVSSGVASSAVPDSRGRGRSGKTDSADGLQVGDHQCSHCGERKSGMRLGDASLSPKRTGTCGRPKTEDDRASFHRQFGTHWCPGWKIQYDAIERLLYGDFRSVSKIIARPFLSFKDVFRDVFVCADILRLSLENSLLVL